MSETPATSHPSTYFPEQPEDAELRDLVAALRRRGQDPATSRPALMSAGGSRIEVPEAFIRILTHVAECMEAGMAVSVVPRHLLLTTQEAADILGISRPTLIRLLESGEIPHEMRGRHRRVRYVDVEAYQQRVRDQRHEALGEMVRDAEEAGLYETLDGPPHKTR